MIPCPTVDGQINQPPSAGSGGSPQPADFNVAASCRFMSPRHFSSVCVNWSTGGHALKKCIALRLGGTVDQGKCKGMNHLSTYGSSE